MLSLLKSGGQEGPIQIYSSGEEDPEKDPEEYPKKDLEELEDYLKEPSTKDVDLANEKNKAQEEDSMIEDSHESREYFKMFENKKRKRNVVRSRFFRPRSCKKKEVFPFTT